MKKANSTVLERNNVSLVAFYGEKPVELLGLIQQLQTSLADHPLLEGKFVPYQLEQVHGTIIGCEGFSTNEGVISQWFKEGRQETRYIDFPGLLDYLQEKVDLHVNIRFGGYKRQTKYNFFSRRQHLSERSWQLQTGDNETIPVVIGWSWKDGEVTLAIDNLRRSFQQFNLLHKYHSTPEALDNDFYLRLGTINCHLTPTESKIIATETRNLLEARSALLIPITVDNLAFVQYQDLLLTPSNTKVIPLAGLTSSQLEQLYN